MVSFNLISGKTTNFTTIFRNKTGASSCSLSSSETATDVFICFDVHLSSEVEFYSDWEVLSLLLLLTTYRSIILPAWLCLLLLMVSTNTRQSSALAKNRNCMNSYTRVGFLSTTEYSPKLTRKSSHSELMKTLRISLCLCSAFLSYDEFKVDRRFVYLIKTFLKIFTQFHFSWRLTVIPIKDDDGQFPPAQGTKSVGLNMEWSQWEIPHNSTLPIISFCAIFNWQ